jgi:hypothetical protein
VPQLASEIARLSKENSELRDRLSSSESQVQPLGIGYQGVLRVLESRALLAPLLSHTTNLLDRYGVPESDHDALIPLLELGLLKRRTDQKYRLLLSEEGISFLNWLKLKELDSNGSAS